jgi:mannose/fructose-specific phosphotransferase system component IIA
MIHALIVTHGLLGEELLRCAEALLGHQEGVQTISNEGQDLEGLCNMVASRIPKGEDTILFVDFCGGSPYVACRRACESSGKLAVISGVNLPMLTSFFTKRTTKDYDELVEIVREDGLRGIQLMRM